MWQRMPVINASVDLSQIEHRNQRENQMNRLTRLAAVLLTLHIGKAMANDFTGFRNGIQYRLIPQTQLRTLGTVMQQYDWSCASAAMAGLVREKFAIDVQEQALFDLIVAPIALDTLALSRLEQEGMTVAHLGRMAGALQLVGRGIARTLGGLVNSQPLPVIARITESHPDDPAKMYQHWVVIRAIVGNRVMVRDSVRGNRRLPLFEFEAAWVEPSGKFKGKGLLFEVEKAADQFQPPRISQTANSTN